MYIHIWLYTIFFALLVQVGCLGVGNKKVENKGKKQVLRAGELQENTDPLPNYIPYYLDSFVDSKLSESQLRYRAWDFNKDGRIDMLETLDKSGNVEMKVYDLDFDGTIDEIKKTSPKKTPAE